nr:ORF3 [Torque teno felis virus]
MGWFHNHQGSTDLKPRDLLKKEIGRKMSLISGPEISTPTVSSRKELLKELLDIIQDLSDAKWNNEDDLDISLKSLPESSQTEDSSSEEEWEMTPPTPPPKKGGDKKLKYVQF